MKNLKTPLVGTLVLHWEEKTHQKKENDFDGASAHHHKIPVLNKRQKVEILKI